MEQNLGDSLNLDNAMANMDFDSSSVVIKEDELILEPDAHDDRMPMEFENTEEEQMLMDTGNEEIIVSDFGDQFTLQEYTEQDQHEDSEIPTTDSNQFSFLPQKLETLIDYQYQPDITENIQVVKTEVKPQQKYIAVKAAHPPLRNIAPKQVMIAPKPISMSKSSVVTKQFAIAPKPPAKSVIRPVQLVKSSVLKVSLANLVQNSTKPNTVIAQLGNKLVMLPAGGAQKIKLVPASTGSRVQYVRTNKDQIQILPKKVSEANTSKSLLTKVMVQGQSNTDISNQPAVLTKLIPVTSTAINQQTRYVMQQKTVPISLTPNKVVLTPTKQTNLKLAKKQQLVTVKSPTPKLLPSIQSGSAKKVVITTKPNQSMVLKTTTPTKALISKEGALSTSQTQRTQLHQINVPGKGIQYIRLVTNQLPAKPRPAVAGNTFVLTDNKGNLIQMTAEKMVSGQPPPLVVTGNIDSPTPKVTQKSPKKFVRIAPVTSKAQAVHQTRSSQSLLAPISPTPEPIVMEEISVDKSKDEEKNPSIYQVEKIIKEEKFQEDSVNEKNASRSLLLQNADTQNAKDVNDSRGQYEVQVEFDGQQSSQEEEKQNSRDCNETENNEEDEHPLIIIPSNYPKVNDKNLKEKTLVFMDNESEKSPVLDKSTSSMNSSMLNVEAEIVPYISSSSPPMMSDSDVVNSNDLAMRPRKACNCTKSQCLKLYCDCFANGEFCNNCNCHNCYNNLDNEEFRQKAIRACLDRNPNAFRPKIGKSKTGGPEPVRRHTKGCNCKRSGCLKNYCECFEAKIACTTTCKCVGCRNTKLNK